MRAVFFLFPFISLFCSPSLLATLAVQPNNGGSVSGASGGGNTFYYFVSTGAASGVGSGASASTAFLNFTPLNLMIGSISDSNLGNMFTVTITSTNVNYTTASATEQPVITIQAIGNSGGGTTRFAPIAAVNGVACNGNICQGQAAYNNTANGNGGSATWYYAAKFFPNSNNSMTIGFYPTDICSDSVTGQNPTGCVVANPSSITAPAAGIPGTLSLTFSVMAATDQISIPQGNALDSTTSPIMLSFQVDSPILNCAPETVLQNDYTPADSSIVFTSNGFSMSQSNSCSTCAPANSFIVVGKSSTMQNDPNAYPVVDQTFSSANSVVGMIVPSAYPQVVGGFTNSTSNTPYYYQLSFLYQDQTGQYVSAGSSNGVPTCLLSPVQTAAIEGFLGKSNCFIATAAFGSGESPPVRMLRKFRDSFLLDFGWGQSFVRWYYDWSPPLAQWLEENPFFRLPVLLSLAPLEFAVWMVLHPLVAVVVSSAGFLLLFVVLWMHGRMRSLL